MLSLTNLNPYFGNELKWLSKALDLSSRGTAVSHWCEGMMNGTQGQTDDRVCIQSTQTEVKNLWVNEDNELAWAVYPDKHTKLFTLWDRKWRHVRLWGGAATGRDYEGELLLGETGENINELAGVQGTHPKLNSLCTQICEWKP